MDVSSSGSSENIYDIRSAGGGPICITEKKAVEPILLYGQARSPLLGDGRTTPRLGLPEQATVRFSSPQSDSISSGASTSYQVSDDSDNALVAEGAMAPRVD